MFDRSSTEVATQRPVFPEKLALERSEGTGLSAACHPVVWLLWLLAAALPALTTRNPLYLVIVLLAAALVYQAVAARSPFGRDWRLVLRFALTLWAFTLAFDVLTWHYGATPLLTLPDNWPVVGGPITLEALAFGLTSGLALATLLLVFAAFNAAVDHYQLLRLLPPFIYQAGLVTSIALTFVPQTVASLRDIREAQMLRGHRFRGLRDLVPLLLPLLTTGLERAIQLAESMEARAFAYANVPAPSETSEWSRGFSRFFPHRLKPRLQIG